MSQTKALALLCSERGQYIVSQALCLAVESINSRPKHEQEPSNVADMELLIEELFPLYRLIEEAQQLGQKTAPKTAIG